MIFLIWEICLMLIAWTEEDIRSGNFDTRNVKRHVRQVEMMCTAVKSPGCHRIILTPEQQRIHILYDTVNRTPLPIRKLSTQTTFFHRPCRMVAFKSFIPPSTIVSTRNNHVYVVMSDSGLYRLLSLQNPILRHILYSKFVQDMGYCKYQCILITNLRPPKLDHSKSPAIVTPAAESQFILC